MAEIGAGPGQGLVLVDSLPLRWGPADPDTVAAEVLRHHDHNEEVLRVIAALEETPAELGEEHQPLAQEMARLDVKLNVLLGLVGQLLLVHFPLPPRRAVRLSPFGVEWAADCGPQPGETGTIELWLSSRCPKPLVLAARAESAADVDLACRYAARFTLLTESLRDRLEKIIFRHHRRSVALTRRRTQSSE